MPKLFNLDPFPVVPNPHALAVMPGDSYEFTDEQVKAGITGNWSEDDPRQPPPVPTQAAVPAASETTEPAPAGEGAGE